MYISVVASLPNNLRMRSKLLAAAANTLVPLPVYPETERTLDGSAGAESEDFLEPKPPVAPKPPPADFLDFLI